MNARSYSHALFLASLLGLVACGDESTAAHGRVCPTCEPELGGDTGDFGGTPTLCGGYRVAEPVDVAQATALGFDVAELERRVARPIDMPLGWRASETLGGGPATGYRSPTRVTATVSSRHTYRHVRPDPQYCDGTSCRFPAGTVLQATCPRLLETDVTAQIETADGALKATLTGTAWSLIPGSEGEGESFANLVVVTTRTKLSDVSGSLRIAPDPGAQAYHTWLQFWARLDETSLSGEISPNVMLQHDDERFTGYHPLLGSLPPYEPRESPLDAGISR